MCANRHELFDETAQHFAANNSTRSHKYFLPRIFSQLFDLRISLLLSHCCCLEYFDTVFSLSLAFMTIK